jgi:ferrous iron transport protein B
VLRPFGLPGNAFVPLLSSHACALPGILATRGIPDMKQRLATILVAPFMTCSARLPVYVLLTSLLFAGRPGMAALAFVGCYALGMAAGVFSALIARRTILRGHARPMAMELPSYKRPSMRTALATTFDRGYVFLKNAGTVILAISVVMWWLGAYPKAQPPKEAVALRESAESAKAEHASGQSPFAEPVSLGRVAIDSGPYPSVLSAKEALAQADHLESIHQKTHSFMGRIGRTVQPVFSPMDWDWRVCIGVMASFVAREVFVSTMSVVIAGEENDNTEDKGLIANMANARRDDGVTPVFTPRVSWSLLVFYVLAMQCLATLVLTAKEAGGKKWALLQFGWMSMLAYAGALITYHVVG